MRVSESPLESIKSRDGERKRAIERGISSEEGIRVSHNIKHARKRQQTNVCVHILKGEIILMLNAMDTFVVYFVLLKS